MRRWSAKKQQKQRAETHASDSESGEALESQALESAAPEHSAHDANEEISRGDVQSAEKNTGDDTRENEQLPVLEREDALEPLLSDEDMPEIATLSASSDLTGFFNRGVSARLRRAALRHVFQLPSYNVRDGLNDYDDDFTNFEPLGDTVTSDMKWHAARKERERLEREKLEEEARQLEQASLTEAESETIDEDDEAAESDEKTHASDSESDDQTAASDPGPEPDMDDSRAEDQIIAEDNNDELLPS